MKAFEGNDTRHGKVAGWRLHQALGQDPCPACYAAKSDYDRRRNLSDARTRQSRQSARAQGRASKEMRRRYPKVWAKLYAQAKADVIREEAQA